MKKMLSFVPNRSLSTGLEKRIIARELLKPVRKEDNFISEFLAPVYTRNGWKVAQKELTESNLSALRHFDSFYSTHYGVSTWSVIRAALLCPAAKVALVNSFYKSKETKPSETRSNIAYKGHIDVIEALHKTWFHSNLHRNWIKAVNSHSEIQDCTNQNLLQLSDKEQISVESERSNLSEFIQASELISEHDFISKDLFESMDHKTSFSQHLLTSVRIFHDVTNEEQLSDVQPAFLSNLQHLKVLAREPGSTPMLFDPPKRDILTNKVQFYPLDLSSVLTVLAMGLQPGQSVLDLCAAPGGKSLVMLQTMNPKRLVCCDTSPKRLERLKNVLHCHGPDLDDESHISVRLATPQDLLESEEMFDRVLVDVPCSTDRQAVTSDLGSLFSKGKSNERLGLPEKQEKLLLNAMRHCKVGGSIVYSTCTLSPAQNEHVVDAALQKNAREKPDRLFGLVNLGPLAKLVSGTKPLSPIWARTVIAKRPQELKVPSSFKFVPIGIQILPTIAANFGPSFVAKIKRYR